VSARGAYSHVEVQAGCGDHVDQGVDAEEVDLASREIGDPGLRDAAVSPGPGA